MKTDGDRYRTIKKLVCATLFCCPCGQNDGFGQDPETETAGTQSPKVILREGPLRMTPHEIEGEAKIPDDVEFGYMCDVNGIIQKGDWKIIGTVIGHEQGMLTIETEEFRVGDKVREESHVAHFAYRLPHELMITIDEGEPITILHDHETNRKRLEWNVHLSSGPKLILATTHLHDDSPPMSADSAEVLFDDFPGGHMIFYWSDPREDDLVQDTKEKPDVRSPLSIKVRGDQGLKTMEHVHEEMVPIRLDGIEYLFAVLGSQHHETESHASHAEEDAEHGHEEELYHSVECLLMRAPKSDRR